jgi:predicted dehydrogenase
VIAVDPDENRLNMAQDLGAELCLKPQGGNYTKDALHYTQGRGADVVLFCAATDDGQALSDAFAMTRKKGRLIMVGVWGRELRREDIYGKELDFLISTSYGPGRYDPLYEEHGLDYPYAYVRWTENRNMAEYLRLLGDGKMLVKPLIQAIYPLDRVEEAFALLQSPQKPLVVLLDYGTETEFELPGHPPEPSTVKTRSGASPVVKDRVRIGLIGAGDFATNVHLPNMKTLKDQYVIKGICDVTGHKAESVSEQYGAGYSTSDYRQILSDPDIDLVMVCTRHNLHGKMVLESLKAGKHTFVEKPLCTTREELDAIRALCGFDEGATDTKRDNRILPMLTVGFNRRYSKFAREVKKYTSIRINPLFIHYRMNAGYVPMDHWLHSEEGGGRIIGEACHIFDLFSYLVDSPVKALSSGRIRPRTGSISRSDNISVVLEYEDGSIATLEYIAVGSSLFPKEYLEVHFDEKTIVVDDYRSISGYGIRVENLKSQISDKGHLDELAAVSEALREGKLPIPLESIFETTKLAFDVSDS